MTSVVAAVGKVLGGAPARLLFRHGGSGPTDTTQVIAWGAGPSPLALIKVARGERGREALANEATRLTRLADSATPSVPCLLGFHRHGEMSLLVESHLRGRRLKDLDPTDRRRHSAVEQTVDWLIDFTRRNPLAAGAPADFDPLALIESHRLAFSLDRAESRLLDELGAALPRVFPDGLPMVAAHGDLSDANVLVGDGDVAVIDWAEPRPWLPAGADLFHFYLSLALTDHGLGQRDDFERGFAAVFLSDGEWSRRFQSGFRRYRSALGIPDAGVPALFTLAWLAFARAKLEYAAELSVAPATAVDVFAQPQTLYPVVFFADGGCLNLRQYARHPAELRS